MITLNLTNDKRREGIWKRPSFSFKNLQYSLISQHLTISQARTKFSTAIHHSPIELSYKKTLPLLFIAPPTSLSTLHLNSPTVRFYLLALLCANKRQLWCDQCDFFEKRGDGALRRCSFRCRNRLGSWCKRMRKC